MHFQHTYALSHALWVINPYQSYVTITVFNSGYHYRLFCRAFTTFMQLSVFEYQDFHIKNALQLSAVFMLSNASDTVGVREEVFASFCELAEPFGML